MTTNAEFAKKAWSCYVDQVTSAVTTEFETHGVASILLKGPGFEALLYDVADGRFKWMTFDIPQRRYREQLGGHVIDHAMVRWDAINRDRPGQLATKYDRCVKGGQILERVLKDSQDAELLVLATWNDLGEGTGIERNYDYYIAGAWAPPTKFMSLTRAAQCSD